MIDHVNGVIIGGEYYHGKVFYNGRQQGQSITADSQDELIQKADELISELKHDVIKHGLPIELSCYADNNKWELRIY